MYIINSGKVGNTHSPYLQNVKAYNQQDIWYMKIKQNKRRKT